ncbi:hypothetical protein Tco_0414839 [Tanacetum coccineum]
MLLESQLRYVTYAPKGPTSWSTILRQDHNRHGNSLPITIAVPNTINQAEVNKRKCKGTGQRENRPVWNNVNRVNHQNQFVPTAVLTRTGKIQVNTARASSTNNVNTVRASSTKDVSTARLNFNSQAVPTNAARKVNTVKPIVNNVNTAEVKSVSAVGGKWKTVVKPSAGCNWRPKRNYWNKVSKYNGGSNSRNCVTEVTLQRSTRAEPKAKMNPVFHSKTKHIEIRHHFIRDAYEKKLIQVLKIHTDDNVADLLTKAFDVSRKTDRNTGVQEIMDFLTRSSIYYALTVSHVVSTTFVEQSWMSAKSKTINNVRYITATVAGKPVTILEASIRNDLLFDDADVDRTLETIRLIILYYLANGGRKLRKPSEYQPIPSPPHLSEDQPESQPDPSLRPSPSIPFLDSNPEGSGGNHGGHHPVTIQAKKIKDLKAQIKKLKKKTRPETAKSKPTAHKDQAFDDPDDFGPIDYMETEDAHNEKGVSTEDQVNTVKPDEGTDKPKVSTDKIDECTTELKNGNSDKNATPTATLTVFGDDETIAEFLTKAYINKIIVNIEASSKIDPKDKARSSLRKKLNQKGLEEWETEEKNKKLAEEESTKLQEEEREKFTVEERAKLLHDTIAAQRRFLAQQRAAKIRNTSQGMIKLIEKENDELRLCLTIATDEDKEVDYEILERSNPIIEWKTEYLGTKPQEDINAVYQLVMDRYQDEIPEGFDRVLCRDLMIMFNPRIKSNSYLVEKKYPLRRKVLLQMLELKLESEEDSTMALELIRFV